ncbi:hypothetical protein EJ05DRAFT_518745 [Pseudovirgaria hyperparasitica]|uniref:Uncharacterized protein n=1 Tax=Pseudovirgaria hyperparasitica TaxID=470096 RepID=A0A6A6VZL8_9PEZI|nr:uncharacterized protein EJ05DRAFT_518745 [Pseudovirgaria hyperparasitica]KAF2756118.1 hypothetical protein EJ05DRAFT_518745 [Pseudovirgaria hyperparasitica]
MTRASYHASSRGGRAADPNTRNTRSNNRHTNNTYSAFEEEGHHDQLHPPNPTFRTQTATSANPSSHRTENNNPSRSSRNPDAQNTHTTPHTQNTHTQPHAHANSQHPPPYPPPQAHAPNPCTPHNHTEPIIQSNNPISFGRPSHHNNRHGQAPPTGYMIPITQLEYENMMGRGIHEDDDDGYDDLDDEYDDDDGDGDEGYAEFAMHEAEVLGAMGLGHGGRARMRRRGGRRGPIGEFWAPGMYYPGDRVYYGGMRGRYP